MGKKSAKNSDLGRSLIKDRSASRKKPGSSLLHTAELQDGQDYNRINFKSITEQTDIDSFLLTAELAGTDFQAEKMNSKFVKPSSSIGILTIEEKKNIRLVHEKHKSNLQIPRRPEWNKNMKPEELDKLERESFLEWRRNLSQLQEEEDLVLTPYEKNLEFWRQLWRVVERSNVVVQILDARNPLLFFCEDLHNYVNQNFPSKKNLLLINKSDFLTCSQRKTWASYFATLGLKVVFFSALVDGSLDQIKEEEERVDDLDEDYCVDNARDDNTDSSPSQAQAPYINSSKILTRSELIQLFRSFNLVESGNPSITIGLVGYPNVGKSSTINSLLQEKKVSVSATPGKTKHFQTLHLDHDVILCDCPGLVFPAFVCTKEEMIINGILPIDQMRDHVPPMNLILSQIPRHVLEEKYGIFIPVPEEGEDPDRPPTSEEFLNSYGLMRGYMTHHGMPDNPRTARYILKDYINGKILYCEAPPGHDQLEYHTYKAKKERKSAPQPTPQQKSTMAYNNKRSEDIDAFFFDSSLPKAHTKSKNAANVVDISEHPKPWRLNNKRNTRVKSRIKYAHLDK